MQTLLLFNNTTRDGHFWLKPQAIGLPIFCQQNATEIENAFIYVTKRSMQTLQLQLQLFNNTTRDGHFQLKPQAIDLPLFCLQNATYLAYFAWRALPWKYKKCLGARTILHVLLGVHYLGITPLFCLQNATEIENVFILLYKTHTTLQNPGWKRKAAYSQSAISAHFLRACGHYLCMLTGG